MDLYPLGLEEIKKGFRFCDEAHAFSCNYCEFAFPMGEVFSMGGHLYDAEHAAAKHVENEHGGNFKALLHNDSKYNNLTENQKELLRYFYLDTPDKEIAQKLGISVSTVRHQKFTFREKAKQAKLFLALFEQAFGDKPANAESLVPIHEHAAFYDERYVITEQEKQRILDTVFSSLNPLKLKVFPPKEKKKVVILTKIAEQFKHGVEYTEKEVNQIIRDTHDDYTTLRRYLIMYGFMERAQDGSKYWVTR